VNDAVKLDPWERAPSPYEHLTVETAQLLNAPLARRLARVDEDNYVGWDQAEDALEEMQRLFLIPDGTRRPIMLVRAHSGMGKSTLVTEFCERNHINDRTGLDRSGRRALLLMSMAGLKNPEDVKARFFSTLGMPIPTSKYSREGMADRIVAAICREQIRLTVLEECQSMARIKDVEQVCEDLRHISNICRRPIVMLGSSDTELAMDKSHHFATRKERCDLPRWQNPELLREFIDALLSIIPLPRPSTVTDDVSLMRLIEWTGGITEFIVKTVRKAARAAIKEELKFVDFDLLKSCMINGQSGGSL
jgi:hypothetical protein